MPVNQKIKSISVSLKQLTNSPKVVGFFPIHERQKATDFANLAIESGLFASVETVEEPVRDGLSYVRRAVAMSCGIEVPDNLPSPGFRLRGGRLP